MSYVLLLKTVYIVGHRRGIKIFCLVFYTPAAKCFSHHTPQITDRCVNTVTLSWMGALHERAPFGVHDTVVGFVYRRLLWTPNLAASD